MGQVRRDWLRVTVPPGAVAASARMAALLDQLGLHTVCQSARCPNLPTCWGAGTATFMLLGQVCTRACRFCSVPTGWPGGRVDTGEPARVAQAVAALGLDYAVLTSVDRDDLPDGGAGQFAAAATAVRRAAPQAKLELLIPDFGGQQSALEDVVATGPTVVGHNLETVRRLTPQVRDPRAGYERSLAVLRRAKELAPALATKSSLLLGLGEGPDEVAAALVDLRAVGVDIVVLGQYLRPTPDQLPVARYVPPNEFAAWQAHARSLGFRAVVAAPLARTSFRAAAAYRQLR
ncbi:MAG: lipoyl synthase [Candidatus Bipolaricaulaceae bacterium]